MGKRRSWRSDHRQERDGSGAAIRVGAKGAPLSAVRAEVGRFEFCDCLCDEKNAVKAVRAHLVRDRALVFSPRIPFALVPSLPKNAKQNAGGAAGGVWGGMPPRPPHCDLRSPFSGDFVLSAKLLTFLINVRTFFAANPEG